VPVFEAAATTRTSCDLGPFFIHTRGLLDNAHEAKSNEYFCERVIHRDVALVDQPARFGTFVVSCALLSTESDSVARSTSLLKASRRMSLSVERAPESVGCSGARHCIWCRTSTATSSPSTPSTGASCAGQISTRQQTSSLRRKDRPPRLQLLQACLSRPTRKPLSATPRLLRSLFRPETTVPVNSQVHWRKPLL
jgi:hypothetical protein